MIQAAIIIGIGLATTGLIGTGVGIGVVIGVVFFVLLYIFDLFYPLPSRDDRMIAYLSSCPLSESPAHLPP
jgi:hypothetical protein